MTYIPILEQKAHEKGREQERRDSILDIVTTRFGGVPDDDRLSWSRRGELRPEAPTLPLSVSSVTSVVHPVGWPRIALIQGHWP